MLCACLLIGFGGLYAQNGTVSGTVLDENGDGLSGANVLVGETGKGALSGLDGSFQIKGVPAGDHVVTVSYLGYNKFNQTVTVGTNGNATVRAALQLEDQELDDVLIVGYGTQRKRENTGSIAKISSRELTEIPGSSIEAGLQGKAAGVQVITGSGIAGSGAVVRVRGINSISAGGDPLYVVDGIPITQSNFLNNDRGGQNNNPLSSINPGDIESIEVLKDAAAAAIYGSRGANGVVLITTKRGKSGKPQFNLTTRVGISQPTILQDLVNTDEWVQLYLEAWENDGNTGVPDLLPGGITVDQALANGTTDWQDLSTGTGFKQEYQLSMRQGTEKLKTYTAISYLDNESYLLGNSYRRYTGRFNADWSILRNLTLKASTSLAWGRNNKIDQAWSGGLGSAQSNALPYFTQDQTAGFSNPIVFREHRDWRTIETRSINTATLEYKPIEDLTININGSYDFMDLGDHFLEDSVITNTFSIAKNTATQVNNWNVNGYAQYNFSFLPEDHKLSLMVGQEAQKFTTRGSYTEVSDVNQHLYLDWEGTENSDTTERDELTQITTFLSTFGRANYSFRGKYLLQASLRVDGSSRFGRNNRYGWFPAVGAGWIISDESFWKDNISAISFFKLKSSFGITGNAEIQNYLHYGRFNGPNLNGIVYNNDSIAYPENLENPDLQWETAATFDVGFEMGFLQDRFTIDFGFYNRESRNVLLEATVQSSTGWKKQWTNIGQVRNRGVELSVKSRNLVGGYNALKWTTTLNVAHNRNTVIDVGLTPPDALQGSGDTRVIEGHPIGVNYLVRFSRVDAQTGLPVFLDADGNETFEWSENNRVIVGNVQPWAQGGIRNEFTWKNWDLNVLFNFSLGGKIYIDHAKRQLGVVKDWNMDRDIINRWTGPGDTDAKYPRLTLDPTTYGGMGSEWFYNTTQWLHDASFGRLKTVTFGYNFRFNPEKKNVIKGLRLYFNGTNLLTITNVPGIDPEVVRDHNGPQGRNISPNVTYLTPPQERIYSVGVNVDF
ncbi:MAG: TonB-dependent receptor [Bacteroidota bacterium]